MKPLFLLFAVLLFALPSFSAERVCKARRGYEAHQSFCRGLNPFACNAHSSLCRQVIIPAAEGSCTSRRGHEGHESFCSGLSSFACNAHNSLCRWIEGWDD